MIIGAIPFGLLFGALAVGAGLSVWQALGMSLLVFAGAAQFIAVGLLGAGAGVAVIVLTTLIVNARHALYSASLQPVIKHLALPWRMGLAFGLTDECYAVMLRRLEQGELGEHGHWYFAGTVLAMFSSWQLCSLLGALFGQALPNVNQWGLEFALVASFIGILLPMLKHKPQWLAALVAGGVAVLTRHWPYNTGLLLATAAGIACGVLFEMRSTAKEPS
ncbi:AzlC family ABC transporter permease [Atopomonas sediminilitoris]|uniref:AzlC family ABC transporter permease n=1 Tax=Atopomonas sediminilitoris TaxID=2919919 RepID=UPI001F4E146F|nr:AzlC family ABC transporter permease [Atopomonas sediminilitoris]MCJ8170140.1 AzlC family ABC transporter permease [Atopomonas sediminilitoris]